ncbi:hypothetical protein G4B88_012501 [Cannabis sativa]|uniref:Uncharacterized protein n=1 Tax=Cannabis sativa TaxID=3483 RepID=A0A7J6I5W2_CANSA|nr:hypothetical protein G4B88_012501 [Cannabis sativa]
MILTMELKPSFMSAFLVIFLVMAASSGRKRRVSLPQNDRVQERMPRLPQLLRQWPVPLRTLPDSASTAA